MAVQKGGDISCLRMSSFKQDPLRWQSGMFAARQAAKWRLRKGGEAMKKIILSAYLALIMGSPVAAETAVEQETARLSECLVMKTTGADRVTLVRWMTFAFMSHPAIKDQIALVPAAKDEANKQMAELIVELLAQRCRTEVQAVMKLESSGEAIKVAFSTLGKTSANEIFSNEEVNKSLSGMDKHLDISRLQEALQ